MSEPTFLETWRMTRGRHRAAIRLTLLLLALGVAPTVVRGMADTFAGIPAIGGVLDVLDHLLRLRVVPAPSAVAAFSLVVYSSMRIHPALAPAYLAGLTSTPWRPGRRLPLGDFGLASTFVVLPALAIGLLWLLRQPSVGLIAAGAALAYAVVAVFTGLVTRHVLVPLLIGTLIVALIPAATAETWMPFQLLLLTLVVVSGLAQRSILASAFGPDGVADIRRLALQRRSTLGWFENLQLTRRRRNVPLEAFSSLALGAAVAMIGTAARGWEGAPWLGLLGTCFFVFGCVRVALSMMVAPLSFGPIARVLGARWFVWRMDRLLIYPLSMLAWISLTYVMIQLPWSPWNPLIAGACVAGAAMLSWWAAPSTIAWQTTGACRILTVATKQQKQAEASLKRLTDPQSSRPR